MYPSGLMRKTVYFYPEEWEAIRREASESQKSCADIVRMAVRDRLSVDDPLAFQHSLNTA